MNSSNDEHLTEFGGLPVVDWPLLEEKERGVPDVAPGEVAWRISTETYEAEETWPEAFARFAAAVDLGQVRALVVGGWEEAYEEGPGEIIEVLVKASDRLTSLRAVFLADMTYEECEISWITQGLPTPMLAAYPDLEVLGIRGGNELVFPPTRHERLRELVVQTGGMSAEVVRGIAASDFPALTTLDLWLGTSNYGGDCTVGDLAPFLAGTRLPALRRLGLRDSEIQDEVAAACASAPVVANLEVLDLSMGVLTDEGAAALLGGQPLTHLRELDLHHNYFTPAVLQRLRESLEPAGVRLDLGENTDDTKGTAFRYVAVGE